MVIVIPEHTNQYYPGGPVEEVLDLLREIFLGATGLGGTGPTGPTGAGSTGAGGTGPTGPTGAGGTGPTGPTGAGVAAGNDKDIQFNDGGVFGGVDAFTFDKTTNTLSLGFEVDTQTGVIIRTPDATTTDFRAPSLTILVGNSKGEASGQNCIIHAGDGGEVSGEGGLLDLQAGDAPGANGPGGTCALQGGSASGVGNGGTVEVACGSAGTDGNGGNVNFQAGVGGTNSGPGGYVQFNGGNAIGGDSDGGAIFLNPGAASGAGVRGNVFVSTLDTNVAAPAISGSTKMVICGSDGALSFTDRPPTIENVQAIAQAADIAATSFVTNAPGLYRLSYYLVDTAADITAGTVRATFTYTDAATGQTVNSAAVALITLGAFTQGTLFIQLASGDIQYMTTHTGIFGAAAYNLYMTLEKVG